MAGPLDGIKVFDMTIAGVGPNASMMLATMGANVIKIEIPGPNGELVKRNNPLPQQKGTNTTYMSNHWNKRSVLLNFKKEQDRAVGYKLCSEADIFVNNMRVGAAERLGFGYEDVRKINPRIIYVYSSGWGTTGPMRDLGAADPVVQVFSGSTSVNGPGGDDGEMLRFSGHYDHVTSNYIALAVLLGLYRREQTGKGEYIETNMLGSALGAQSSRVGEYFATGKSPKPLGSASSVTAPHEAYICKDKEYIAVAALDNDQWQRLCQALGKPELAKDPRFVANPDRVTNRNTLSAALAPIFATKGVRWWELRLAEARVPSSRFIGWHEYINLPQARLNGHVIPLNTEQWGTVYTGDVPWKFSGTPAELKPNPAEGEHTAEILANPTFAIKAEK